MSCPDSLLPKHATSPLETMAQKWPCPQFELCNRAIVSPSPLPEKPANGRASPNSDHDAPRDAVSPLRSWPLSPKPMHFILEVVPELNSTHEAVLASATCFASLERPVPSIMRGKSAPICANEEPTW